MPSLEISQHLRNLAPLLIFEVVPKPDNAYMILMIETD